MTHISSNFEHKQFISKVFRDNDLMFGRMISGSKTYYRERYPNHNIVFNANIITINDNNIWCGDLDVTIDESKLKRIAKSLDQDLYILREEDIIFHTDESINSLISYASYIIKK
jgi:hypothetical protein